MWLQPVGDDLRAGGWLDLLLLCCGQVCEGGAVEQLTAYVFHPSQYYNIADQDVVRDLPCPGGERMRTL
jgi:hypothetical protein